MLAIDTLVPGFRNALAAMPGGLDMAQVLERVSRDHPLDANLAALIHVSVAEHVGGPYARWMIARLAELRGVAAEDVFFATTGTALDARESVLVRAAVRLAAGDRSLLPTELEMLRESIGTETAAALVAEVAQAALACRVLDNLAPREAACRT